MGLYYRYRPLSELSIKELMYDEMYFTSTEESNDPYEGMVFFQFDKSEDKWRRLVDFAWRDIAKNTNVDKYKNVLIPYLVEKAPLTFAELKKITFSELIHEIKDINLFLFDILIKLFKECILTYEPDKQYFVSFSKTADNYLMWSHYANNHNGYCLIFRTIDESINQSSIMRRTSIHRDTLNSVSPRMTNSIHDKFKMNEVIYNSKETTIDAFSCFTPYVYGRDIDDEQERIKYWKDRKKPYLEKNSCWEYEQECRLLLSSPMAWLFGNNIEYSKHERLLHYDSTQLVGIILGSKMQQEDKNRIKAIVREKTDNWYDFDINKTNRQIFNFVLFDAVLSLKHRKIDIIPREIYSGIGVCKAGDENFTKQYNEWEKGYCLEFVDGHAHKKYIE